ncbi:lactadherin-like isoform X3 [Lineus longissimus]|uniref:lactadherin-like isoform X3 n=1 Tax=Lineus longissimus TaxID=88925 RepID=UPI00315D606C
MMTVYIRLFYLFFVCLLAATQIYEAAAEYDSTDFNEVVERKLRACDISGPLGMINGDIQDWQITASSTYPQEWDKACHERFARLYQPNKYGWCAKYKSSSEWLQIDLGVVSKVTGVMTQGRGDGKEWVTSFMVSFSMDASKWDYVVDQYGNQRIFEGNIDSYSVKHSYLDKPVMARFVKFHTVHWSKHPSLRVEIIGCQECKELIGMPPYGKITASSWKTYRKGSSCLPEDGHILSNKAWCSRKDDENQWLQFDVGPPTMITGLVIKGRGDTRKNEWVKRFRLSYSNDSMIWYYYKDEEHLAPKTQVYSWNYGSNKKGGFIPIQNRPSSLGLLFGGNSDKNIPRYHYLNRPFIARFVRLHPAEWERSIAMRAGLIGCPQKGKGTDSASDPSDPLAGSCDKGFVRINEATQCIENIAYKKESFINNQSKYKRHTRNTWMHGHAARAVDGNMDSTLNACTVLDNSYVDNPIWMVDLGKRTMINGAIVHTWQGKGQDPNTTYRDYTYNLEKLVVFIDKKSGRDRVDVPEHKCGYVTRLNNALFKPRIHVECTRQMYGRYVFVMAYGVPDRWSRLFSAILCEVEVY